DPAALLLIEFRAELPQVIGRLDARKLPAHVEEADKRLRIVARIVEPAQPLPRRLPQLAIMAIELRHRILQLLAEVAEQLIELVEPASRQEPQSRFGIGERHSLPERDHPPAKGG